MPRNMSCANEGWRTPSYVPLRRVTRGCAVAVWEAAHSVSALTIQDRMDGAMMTKRAAQRLSSARVKKTREKPRMRVENKSDRRTLTPMTTDPGGRRRVTSTHERGVQAYPGAAMSWPCVGECRDVGACRYDAGRGRPAADAEYRQ